MKNTSEAPFVLKLAGRMTHESYPALEDQVFAAMRRHQQLSVDLSEVTEVDLCGLHLLSLLQSVGVIVASSPIVEQASARLIATHHAAALGRSKVRGRLAASSPGESHQR
jgi:ABC-type transporter Mla MlaB component